MVRLFDINAAEPTTTFPGSIDRLMDIVPVQLRLDEINISINDLRDLISPSFIGLEKVFDYKKESVELTVFGESIASGQLTCTDDTFGILIKKVYKSQKAS